ncbi:unnamed protein product [Parascedosporium putredinis]|uniref:Uncharacterized protein n=1 Tax=Parascedosporium putredinis TaxID=1442378 RepID=A0A9P1MF27_9PEZI|nr:unnamed protein product [Parascedosporium putredinis]CAI8002593.1 unnamed protein product [Parascedosporium putredinis]
MCVVFVTTYVCGDVDQKRVPCRDQYSPSHQIRYRPSTVPDVCNKSNCSNPSAQAASYVASYYGKHDGLDRKPRL